MNANYGEICRIGSLGADFQQVPPVHFFIIIIIIIFFFFFFFFFF